MDVKILHPFNASLSSAPASEKYHPMTVTLLHQLAQKHPHDPEAPEQKHLHAENSTVAERHGYTLQHLTPRPMQKPQGLK